MDHLGPGETTDSGSRAVPVATCTITVTRFGPSTFAEGAATGPRDWHPSTDRDEVTWVHVKGLAEEPSLALGGDYGLHPLAIEDIVTPDERPKLEQYDNYLYVIVKALRDAGDGHRADVVAEQVAVVLGDRFVLSFQEGDRDVFADVRVRLRTGGRIRRLGADHLAYVLLDTVVDEYFHLNEQIGDQLESFEEVLLRGTHPEQLSEVHHLRRQLILFRKAIWPLREVVGLLGRGESAMFGADTTPFLRDLYDHVFEVMDGIETQREIVTGLLDMYLSGVSYRLNEVMKVLTIISTIFIPLTFVAGVYGMNFDYMPELRQPWGYPAALGLMLGISLVMLAYFRRKGWL